MEYPRHVTDGPVPPGSAPSPSALARRAGRGGRFVPARALLLPLVAVATAAGLLLGGRVSAEDGRSAAAALAAGDPARSIGLDEAVAGRARWLMLLDPGAADAAQRDAQAARITWARQLAAAGQVDAAVRVLSVVRQPAFVGEAAQARAQILVAAAAAAIDGGHAELALLRLDEAARDGPPPALAGTIASMRAADEVAAAQELVAAGRAPDAVAVLDDAAAHGARATAAAAYPATLLAAARSQIASLDLRAAASTLERLTAGYGSTTQAETARALLSAPQTVSGTLVTAGGRPLAGGVRLSTHFTQHSGGYLTSAPFFTGAADGNGDFSIDSVPVGGPYVLEFYRGGGWTTLIDPRTSQPARPVTVSPLVPEDLTFIVLPS